MYSFPNFQPVQCSMSGSNCCFLSCIQISQEAGQLVWYSCLKEFSTGCCDPQSKLTIGVVNKAEVDVFLELSCFFDDPTDVGNLISGSSLVPAFSKSSLKIWNFVVRILLRPVLENFEHYFACIWDEYNCVLVWIFFGTAFPWDWNKNWPFPVL